jgi:eukaryotic-like serine/threonine-protein kinase
VSAPVREGDLLDGKYRIDKILGQGGMGVVVAATHVGLGRKVAIKFLLAEATQHPEIIERFEREARAAATIRGRHVVAVSDVGTMQDGRTYMVMEHLEGEDLEHTLEREGSLAPDLAITYVLQACEALAEAHAAGIVHRDLKPANLFLAMQPDKRAIIKVLDFGISKMKDDGRNLTKTSAAVGTPYYMSPEQLMNSKDVDARGDIWALGVILFELISGVRPFSGDSLPEIVAQILGNKRPLLRELRPSVPEELELVVSKCLRTDREDRFADVGELASKLGPFGNAVGRASVQRITRVLGRDLAISDSEELRGVSHTGSGRRVMLSGPPTAVGIAMVADAPAPLVEVRIPKSPATAALQDMAADLAPTEVTPAETAPAASAPAETAPETSRKVSEAREPTSRTNVQVAATSQIGFSSSQPAALPRESSKKAPLVVAGVVLAAAIGLGVTLMPKSNTISGDSKPLPSQVSTQVQPINTFALSVSAQPTTVVAKPTATVSELAPPESVTAKVLATTTSSAGAAPGNAGHAPIAVKIKPTATAAAPTAKPVATTPGNALGIDLK